MIGGYLISIQLRSFDGFCRGGEVSFGIFLLRVRYILVLLLGRSYQRVICSCVVWGQQCGKKIALVVERVWPGSWVLWAGFIYQFISEGKNKLILQERDEPCYQLAIYSKVSQALHSKYGLYQLKGIHYTAIFLKFYQFIPRSYCLNVYYRHRFPIPMLFAAELCTPKLLLLNVIFISSSLHYACLYYKTFGLFGTAFSQGNFIRECISKVFMLASFERSSFCVPCGALATGGNIRTISLSP